MDDRDRLRRFSSRRSGWRSLLSWVGVLAFVMISGLALAACGDDGEEGAEGGLLEEAIDRGYLSVGIANEAPYGFEDENGVPTGEAPEVAKEVLSRLGIPEIRTVVVDFGALIPGLAAGRFDMIAAGMYITPERAEQVLFSDPDYCGTQAFAVAAGNPLDIRTFEDIAENPDAVVGVMGGAVEEGYAEEAGVPEDRMTVFDTVPNLFEGLRDGRIDAVALTSITVNWQVKLLGDPSIEATEGFVPVIGGEEIFACGAYGFRPENQAFRDAFNEELNKMKQNDEILPIVEPFGFTAADINKAKDVTVEDLVGGAE
jgi:polar amino acid transport system substrate-binding protein